MVDPQGIVRDSLNVFRQILTHYVVSEIHRGLGQARDGTVSLLLKTYSSLGGFSEPSFRRAAEAIWAQSSITDACCGHGIRQR